MLIFHIIAAVATLGSTILAVYYQATWNKITFRLLTVLSLSSGVSLAMTPDNLTRDTCIRLGVYLMIIAATEYKLSKSLGSTATRIV